MSAQTPEELITSALWHADRPENNSARILAALSAAGWVVVPRKPTEAMLQTFHDTILIQCRPYKREASVLNDIDVWNAVIAAAGNKR